MLGLMGKSMIVDSALSDLDSGTLTRLMNLPSLWFNTYGFCALDSTPPAERVLLCLDEQRQITYALYYLEKRWSGIFKRIELIGPIYTNLTNLKKLLKKRGARIATVSFVNEEETTNLFKAFNGNVIVERTHEDFIIELPSSVEEYFNSLGSRTRRNLRKYRRDFDHDLKGHINLVTRIKDQISLQNISALVELNHKRVEGKGGKSLWDQELIKKRLKLAVHCGFFCGFELDGQLIGGTLSFIHGDESYGVLLGHDPVFNHLNLGTLCIFETVNHLIGMGQKRAHFQWGKSWFKTQFGGHEYPLFTVTLFCNSIMAQLWELRRILEWGRNILWRLNGNFRHLPKSVMNGLLKRRSISKSSHQSKDPE